MHLGILMKNLISTWQLAKQIDMIIRLSKKLKNSPVFDYWNPQFNKSFDNLEDDLRKDVETTHKLKNVFYKKLYPKGGVY